MTAWKSNPLVYVPPSVHIRNLHNWTLHSSKTWDARQSQVPQVQNSGTCPFFAACFVWLTNPLAFLWSGNNAEPAMRIKHSYVTFLIKTFPLQSLLYKFGWNCRGFLASRKRDLVFQCLYLHIIFLGGFWFD